MAEDSRLSHAGTVELLLTVLDVGAHAAHDARKFADACVTGGNGRVPIVRLVAHTHMVARPEPAVALAHSALPPPGPARTCVGRPTAPWPAMPAAMPAI